MAHTLIRSYDRFSDAQHARDALLSSGFAPSSVHLNSNEDEAGPVEGNAVIDEQDSGAGPGGSPGSLMSNEERSDAYNNAEPVWHASFVLTVDADDESQRSQASDIMDQCGAIDVDARVSARKSER